MTFWENLALVAGGLLIAGLLAVGWLARFVFLPRLRRLSRLEASEEELRLARGRFEQDRTSWAESALRVFASDLPSASFVLDAQGRILLGNAEARRLFGYGDSELEHLTIDALIPGQLDPRGNRSRPLPPGSGRRLRAPCVSGLRASKKDGSTFPVEVVCTPLTVGGQQRILCVVVDQSVVTAQRLELDRINAELRLSRDDLQDFAAVVSHDLKAPLRAIRSAATWIRQDLPGEAINAEVEESLRMLVSRSSRMELLLSGLIKYARAGRGESAEEFFDSHAVLSDCLQLLDGHEAALVQAPAPLPRIEGCRAAYQQVLSNLIENALKHGAATAELRIEVTSEEDEHAFWFRVTDNGPGIASAHHERIFELFRTLRPHDEVEGAGMGLALVRKIVERRGGQVLVSSAEGAGASFRFSWPRRTSEQSASQ